jgi:HD-GYP domain-containing protein (c-di-GMP phosphodiesterase class II)
MRNPFSLDPGPGLMPAVERMLAESRVRRVERLSKRERLAEITFGGAFVVVAIVMAVAVDSGRDFELGPAAALVAAHLLASRIQFDVGAGYTLPVQLVLVPMLLVLPTEIVPLLVLVSVTANRLIDVVRGHAHIDRLLLGPADAWYSVAPALVLIAFDAEGPSWDDAPVYALAFVVQALADAAIGTLREAAALGVSPRVQLKALMPVYLVDGLLWPIGLMAALAADGSPYRTLVMLPLLALLFVFAQEREAHIGSALELSSAYRGTALLLGDVLEDKDAYTASHSHGVVELSIQVADALGLGLDAHRRVEFGALLHDIGKIAVPAEIINKPGPLDDSEWEVMKLHTVEGQQMLDRVGGVLGDVGRVVRSSHEHWDGSGYPDGLAGEAIPIEARIVACCDAFSAMTTDRSYRRAMSDDDAITELLANTGTQFDPQVVECLLGMLKARGTRSEPRPTRNRAG